MLKSIETISREFRITERDNNAPEIDTTTISSPKIDRYKICKATGEVYKYSKKEDCYTYLGGYREMIIDASIQDKD